MITGLYRGKGEYQPRISTNVWEYSYLILCYNDRRGYVTSTSNNTDLAQARVFTQITYVAMDVVRDAADDPDAKCRAPDGRAEQYKSRK